MNALQTGVGNREVNGVENGESTPSPFVREKSDITVYGNRHFPPLSLEFLRVIASRGSA